MIPINGAEPVFVGNKTEAIVPYMLSDEFVVMAEQDGKVIAKENGYLVIEYKNGIKKSIDIKDRVRKNSSAGFWIDNTLITSLEIGNKFKAGEVIAYNDKHFSLNEHDNGVSMNLGALAKIAISAQWDVFEDSIPISRQLSEKLETTMTEEKSITLSKYTYVDKMVKVGDKITAGDSLIVFSDSMTEELQVLFDSLRETNRENIIESAKTSVYSKYTGRVADIRIYSTVPTEELDPSLAKIVKDYQKNISKRNKTLDNNKNIGDLDFYKSGQIIQETDNIIEMGTNNKIKGVEMTDDGVLILFYIQYEVGATKGDKIVGSVCKGVVSHVYEEGNEPYSEYRPDEIIDCTFAQLAVAARKIPAIFLNMWSNKLMIEAKNQLEDIYFEK